MFPALKSKVRQRLPRSAVTGWQRVRGDLRGLRARAARRAFESAPPRPEWLDASSLEALAATPRSLPDYRDDRDARRARGLQRSQRLLELAADTLITRTLEVGCHDAMTSAALASPERSATAIDLRGQGVDPRAVDAGVRFLRMDAGRLACADDHFDLVFSHNAFEHFPDPAAVLDELARVVRPGGLVYLSFNPLYDSAFGLHAWGTVPVPYCQFLFRPEDLDEYARRRGRRPIDHTQLNGWSLRRYRELWERVSPRLVRVHTLEGRNLAHLEWVERYPSCFRNSCDDFESLLVSSIEVMFRRRESGD